MSNEIETCEFSVTSFIFQPQFVNLQRLHTYVDKNQLTHSYGGLLWYHHPEWLQNRIVGFIKAKPITMIFINLLTYAVIEKEC